MSFTFAHDPNRPPLRIGESADFPSFALSVVSNTRVITHAFTEFGIAISDVLYDRAWPDYEAIEGQIVVSGAGGVTFQVLGPPNFTMQSNGQATFLSAGSNTVLVSNGVVVKRANVSVADFQPLPILTSLGYIAGSLGKHGSDVIDGILAGKNAATSRPIFTSMVYGGPYVRNPNFFAKGVIGLPALSPLNRDLGTSATVTMISPRHFIGAAHVGNPVGNIWDFVTADNQLIQRTVVATRAHPNYTGPSTSYKHDIRIGVLDADLPPSIGFIKVMPSNWDDYFVRPLQDGSMPIMKSDFENKGLVTDCALITLYNNEFTPNATPGATFSCNVPINAQRLAFYEESIGGDSGRPMLGIFNLGNGNEFVLFAAMTARGPGYGSFLGGDHVAACNLLIQGVDVDAGNGGLGYTMTQANLSGFTSFA